MLKDLDQRQVEQQGTGNLSVPVLASSSNKKVLFISLLVIVLLNVLGIFVWNMYVENQTFKQQATQKVVTKLESESQDTFESKLILPAIINANVDTQTNNVKSPAAETAQVVQSAQSLNKATETNVRKSEVKTDSSENNLVNANVPVQQTAPIANKSTLKISRKQLSPDELARQKIRRAEQALANKDVTKAEHLFEDVLLVLPDHKNARKQLAALWFGRTAYSDALNLLSQGIALSPNDIEFRLMKARIYLQQNSVRNAFVTLNAMPEVNGILNVEYQSLRATTAQQASEFLFAIDAYKVLVEIEPSLSRWWLGLGVAYDSNSEFKQASIAYKSSLSKTGLSDSAANFARQRIIELGE